MLEPSRPAAGSVCLAELERVRVGASHSQSYETPRLADFVLQAGIFDGKQTEWFEQRVIDAGAVPSSDNWQTLDYPLSDYAGKTVGILIKAAYGGKRGAMNEEAFFDEISVIENGDRNH